MSCYYRRLPSVLIKYIFNYIPLTEQKSLFTCNPIFVLNYVRNMIKIRKIQTAYRKNRIPDNIDNLNQLTNSQMYRFYIANYDSEYFLPYPEFMANKRCLDANRRQTWQNYIDQNMPPIENRKRSDVVKFFKNNNITINEIMIAGW
jgi:hypothetical protein